MYQTVIISPPPALGKPILGLDAFGCPKGGKAILAPFFARGRYGRQLFAIFVAAAGKQ